MSEALPYDFAPCPNCSLLIWPYGLTCGHCQVVKWVLMLRYLDPDGIERSVKHDSVQFFSVAYEENDETYCLDPTWDSCIPWTPVSLEEGVGDKVVIGVRNPDSLSRCYFIWPHGESEVERLGYFYRNRWTGEEIEKEEFPAHRPVSPRPALRKPETPTVGMTDSLTPEAKAIAAAYDLQREGKPVSVRAACLKAGVDRGNLCARYPETARAIEAMSGPDRSIRRGAVDARTGRLEARDSADFG